MVEACQPLTDVPEIGSRACGGLERGLWFGAQHCRRGPGLDEAVCPSIDGREIHEAAMEEFERSWVAQALGLQAGLDRDVPLTEALVLHTHNSANSAAYAPSFTSNDANQVLTITDQLRLGIRGIEIDVHWAPHPEGDPEQGFRAPVQCHGQSESGVHVGCSVDQLLVDLLDEDADRADPRFDYDTTFVRRYEDSTFLSLMANGGSHISPEVAASLVRCGVNLPGLDQLHPGDERLAAFVWSWRDQEPGHDPDRACAAQGDDTRFGALDCARALPVACRTVDGSWAVTETAVPWHEGDRACAAEGHVAAGVPANGWDNQLLRRSADDDVTDVWLAYGRDDSGRWVRSAPALPAAPARPAT